MSSDNGLPRIWTNGPDRRRAEFERAEARLRRLAARRTLAELAQAGIRVRVVDGKLRLSPRELVDLDVEHRVRTRANEIADLLREDGTNGQDQENGTDAT